MQVQDLNISSDLDNAALATVSGGYSELSRTYKGYNKSFSSWVYKGETYYYVQRGANADKWFSYKKWTRTETHRSYYTTLWA